MASIAVFLAILLAAILVSLAAVSAVFRLLTYRRIHSLSTAELEAKVFSEPQEYFEHLGTDTQSITEYIGLVRSRNLHRLHDDWPRLKKAFLKAEVRAGHSGRPLLFDYFLDYGAYTSELLRRNRGTGPKGERAPAPNNTIEADT